MYVDKLFRESATVERAMIVFANRANAERNVAGLPAAARAVREAAEAGIGECWVVAGDGWCPTGRVRGEVGRMANGGQVHFAASGELPALAAHEPRLWISGEALAGAAHIREALERGFVTCACMAFAANGHIPLLDRHDSHDDGQALARAGRRIVADTAKPGDGIVSRHLNRPISQAISRVLLGWPAIRPIHATLVTAMLAIAMFLCLIAGSNGGLIAGALLFQAASIIDGVDGEIARATFRTSDFGAMVDSLIDATTNVAFIAGVVINLWIQGNTYAAMAGAIGLAAMAIGLFLLGRRARAGNQQFTFNAVKDHFSERPSRLKQWLTWLTMRDFYALGGVAFVVTGFAAAGLIAFAVVATGWFVVVLSVLARKTA